MADINYCGKSCAECRRKEALNCPECQAGPGRAISGDCDLAKCCRERGHASCTSCLSRSGCGLYRGRMSAPDIREKRRMEAEKERAYLACSATEMAKWFRVLFWLMIPNFIGSLINNFLTDWLTFLYIPSVCLQLASGVAYCVVLFIMSNVEERYRSAGIFLVIGQVISALWLLINSSVNMLGLSLLLSVSSVVISILAVYHEFRAHADFFEDVDGEMFDYWSLLWKLQIVSYILTFGAVALAVISPMLTVIVMIIGLLVSVLVGILRQILLFRSAKRAEMFAISVEQ